MSIPALEEAMLRLWQLRSVLVLAVLAIICFMKLRRRKVYLVDYACYRPKPEHKMTREVFVDRTICIGSFTEENIDFQRKVIERSGLGAEETYTSEAILRKPAILCMEEAWEEAKTVIIAAIDDLVEKTGVKMSEIGILVVNCSLFNPTPSLSSMIVNHYKLKDDIYSFNLSGMGCSASHISVDLANNLLQVHDNTYAIVVSTENITLNWYRGNDRDMLLPNCLFRMGGAAMLLSNKPCDLPRSKYELLHLVRTNKAYEERSYKCVNQKDDETGNVGVVLSKQLMSVAGDALRSNLTTLGPKVLPISEQAHYFICLLAKRFFPSIGIKGYSPNFMLAFQHFCIHAGGRAVLDEIEKNLNLTAYLMEPSRMTLHKYGNVSSSSTWYEMAYIEAKGRMRKGDKAWQIGFGSGFKCNSIVWLALKTIHPAQEKINPWIDYL